MAPPAAPAGRSLVMLGGFEVRLAGRPAAAFPYNKMRALLAYLAVERERDHRRDDLAEMLWPASDAATSRGNLRRTLSDLRRALEGPTASDLFVATKETIRLLPTMTTDVKDFVGGSRESERESLPAEELAGLYRGEFLAGLTLRDAPAFEEWMQVQREALHCTALALLERLWRGHAQAGRHGKALQFVLRHAELEPWDEDVHRNAMLLYARNGQRGAAIEQHEICSRALRSQLGASPGAETQQLAERIRKGELDPTLAAAPVPVQPPVARAPLERRPVTDLYCELTPSPLEDADDPALVLNPTREKCAQIVQRFFGHVASAHGGALFAYFGYPRADERAARNAVQAALAMTREATDDFEIRVGVHSGIVIAGGDPHLPDAVGRTSKLAARLRHSAAKNQVSISQQTRDVVAGYFDCVSLGAQSVSGFTQPLGIFRVERETSARTRLDAVERMTPFSGRNGEIAALLAQWDRATAGERRVVLLRGEAGIGKSRLLHTLKERLLPHSHVLRELRCLPEFGQSPFHPLTALVESALGLEQGESATLKLAKLASYFEKRDPGTAAECVPVLAQLLSIPLEGPYRVSRASPQMQKERAIGILLDFLAPPSPDRPLLLIVEDMHWIDPSSLELLGLLVARKGKQRVLALFSARPEFVAPWNMSGFTTLELGPLGGPDIAAMVASISADVAAATLQQIVERSDGVPLFAEEMAKLASSDNEAKIPPTLHDLLAVRMDSLETAKPVAQLAASLGREFDVGLLAKVFAGDRALLDDHLATLGKAGLTLGVGASTRQFKHALIQEAAYQSQTRGDREEAHRRIAQTLLDGFPEVVASRPELVARHLSAGGQPRLAVDYWALAGQRASQYSAHAEAVGHFRSGLAALERLPPGHERDMVEFNLLVALCPALYAAVGYGSEEATQANTRLAALSDLVGDNPDLFQAKWALVMNTIANAGSRDVAPRAMQLMVMAGKDPLRQQAAHYAIADAAFWLGRFEDARAHTEQALALYRPDMHPDLLARFGEDLSVSCGAYRAWAQYFLGEEDGALLSSGEMLARARELDHPHTLALALCFASVLHRWMDKPAEALRLSRETMEVSQKYGFSVWLAAGQMVYGWALVRQGQVDGLADLDAGIGGMRHAIGGISVVFLSALVEAYVHLKRYGEARAVLAETQAEVARTGDGHYTARLARLAAACGQP